MVAGDSHRLLCWDLCLPSRMRSSDGTSKFVGAFGFALISCLRLLVKRIQLRIEKGGHIGHKLVVSMVSGE